MFVCVRVCVVTRDMCRLVESAGFVLAIMVIVRMCECTYGHGHFSELHPPRSTCIVCPWSLMHSYNVIMGSGQPTHFPFSQ